MMSSGINIKHKPNFINYSKPRISTILADEDMVGSQKLHGDDSKEDHLTMATMPLLNQDSSVFELPPLVDPQIKFDQAGSIDQDTYEQRREQELYRKLKYAHQLKNLKSRHKLGMEPSAKTLRHLPTEDGSTDPMF